MIKALVEGDLQTDASPRIAMHIARGFRRLLKDHDFSPLATAALERRLQVLDSYASDPSAKARENRKARATTKTVEELAVPGVYVYSLPQYMRHPYDEVTGRTLFKVGRANRDVIKRFREQTRTTALPEDPVLLRVYPCDEQGSTDLEGRFHRLLEAADHDRSKARTGGTEWFLTNLRFLDGIASTLNLEIRKVADLAEPVD
jgi:hypothetical protein